MGRSNFKVDTMSMLVVLPYDRMSVLKISTEPCCWLLFDNDPSCETPSCASCLVTPEPKSAEPKSVTRVFIGGRIERTFLRA